METKNKLKYGFLTDESGRILNETLWEMETEIKPENKLISNFVIKNEKGSSNLKKKQIYGNNSDVELLDKFIKLHEKNIEKVRKFEI